MFEYDITIFQNLNEDDVRYFFGIVLLIIIIRCYPESSILVLYEHCLIVKISHENVLNF